MFAECYPLVQWFVDGGDESCRVGGVAHVVG